MNNNKNVKSRRPRGGSFRRGLRGEAPPSIVGAIKGFRRQRWQATSALTNVSLTPDVLACSLSVAITATTANSVFSSTRLVAIEMWGPPGTTTPATVSCEWQGATNFTVNTIVSDTSIGATFPAHLRTVPPESLQKLWLDAGNTSAYAIVNGPSGTIIDVTFEYVVDTAASGAATNSFTIAGSTPGRGFVRALDGAGGLLLPVSALNYAG